MKKYFYDLNYTLANEDTTLEYRLVKHFNCRHIFTICGSASRATPLIAAKAESLTAIDISQSQLDLLKLKFETIKKFEYADYLRFWGFAPYGVQENRELRQQLFQSLELEESVRHFFISVFEKNQWQGILYTGRWEQTFKTLNSICRKILGRACDDLFAFNCLESQKEYFRKKFPWWRWRLVLLILGNKSMFNALLYKGDFVQKNVKESHYRYYFDAFAQLFSHALTRKSFFLQLCFLGEILFVEGNTIDAHRQTFAEMKEALSSVKIQYQATDLLSAFDQAQMMQKYDFASLSDVPSYFSGEIEQGFMQKVRQGMAIGGIVVLRSYLRVPQADLTGFQDITEEFFEWIADETVQMYRIQILKVVG